MNLRLEALSLEARSLLSVLRAWAGEDGWSGASVPDLASAAELTMEDFQEARAELARQALLRTVCRGAEGVSHVINREMLSRISGVHPLTESGECLQRHRIAHPMASSPGASSAPAASRGRHARPKVLFRRFRRRGFPG